jgi:hypothetical protein
MAEFTSSEQRCQVCMEFEEALCGNKHSYAILTAQCVTVDCVTDVRKEKWRRRSCADCKMFLCCVAADLFGGCYETKVIAMSKYYSDGVQGACRR